MGKLAGKIAVVTGGGRGIGLALVEQLAREGARIIVNDLDAGPAEAAAEAARRLGADAICFVGSVTAPEFPDLLMKSALEAFGDVHIIVNNAGYVWNGPIQHQTDRQWQAMQDVHLAAPFRILRAFHPILKSKVAAERADGQRVMRKVVNVMSVAATGGSSGQVSYSAAKAGLYGLTRTLAKEWGRHDVNVNAVAFGLIDTRLTETGDEERRITIGDCDLAVGFRAETAERLKERIALGRAGTPAEAAGAIMLLCFPESDYISGHILEAAGGLSN